MEAAIEVKEECVYDIVQEQRIPLLAAAQAALSPGGIVSRSAVMPGYAIVVLQTMKSRIILTLP